MCNAANSSTLLTVGAVRNTGEEIQTKHVTVQDTWLTISGNCSSCSRCCIVYDLVRNRVSLLLWWKAVGRGDHSFIIHSFLFSLHHSHFNEFSISFCLRVFVRNILCLFIFNFHNGVVLFLFCPLLFLLVQCFEICHIAKFTSDLFWKLHRTLWRHFPRFTYWLLDWSHPGCPQSCHLLQ